MTDKTEQFLRNQLKIPGSWIYEAKVCRTHPAKLFLLSLMLLEAILCQYHGKVFDAYNSYLLAEKPQMAHDVALDELAQEVILRDDYELLKSLFVTFDPNDIKDWSFRGKVNSSFRSNCDWSNSAAVALSELCGVPERNPFIVCSLTRCFP